MSDQENCVAEQEATPQAKPEIVLPTITPEEFEKMKAVREAKQGMLNQLGQIYGHFINQIRNFPFTPLQQQQAFIRLDEGHFWMQQSIMQAEIRLESPTAPESEAVVPESIPSGEAQPEA